MEPISNSNRTASDEPTPAEIEAGASLPREAEPLECRLTDAPAVPTPAVKALVDKYPPSVSAPPPERSQTGASAPKGPGHPGIALSVGANVAAGPGIAVGAEASVGLVADLSEPKISLFTSTAWGTAVAPGVAAGVSGQVSALQDVAKFWGSGAEHGVNFGKVGVAVNYSTPEPGGPRELNGGTLSLGPGLGGDAHYFEGTTTEIGSLSLHDIKDALKRAIDPTDDLCVGP